MIASLAPCHRLSTAIAVGVCLGGCATEPSSSLPITPVETATEPSPQVPASVAASPQAEVIEPEPVAPVELQIPGDVAAVLAPRAVSWRLGDVRMGVARRGAVRLRTDGAELGLADGKSLGRTKRVMVVLDEERPRVVTDEAGVRLLLYVDRADAEPVVVVRAPMRAKAGTRIGDPPRRGHVVLQPGTWVESLEQADEHARVQYVGRDALFSGWVDVAALGTTFDRRSLEPTDVDERDAHTWITKRGTKLLSKPGGRVMIKLDKEDSVVALTAKASAGYRLVEYVRPCESEISYVGFAATRDLRRPTMGQGYGCGSGSIGLARPWGDAEKAPRVEIEAGRFLLDVDESTVVGCVLRPTELADLGDGTHAVVTHWGPIPVRLAPQSLQGDCGTVNS